MHALAMLEFKPDGLKILDNLKQNLLIAYVGMLLNSSENYY